MTRDTAERARELAVKWLGPEPFYPPMASGASWHQPLTSSTFIIKPYAELLSDLVKLIEPVLTQIQAEARERLAAWMVEHSFSTGHGDTFEDLLKELDWQVKELRRKVAEARLEEAKWWDFQLRREASATTETVQRIAALAQALQPEEKEGTKS